MTELKLKTWLRAPSIVSITSLYRQWKVSLVLNTVEYMALGGRASYDVLDSDQDSPGWNPDSATYCLHDFGYVIKPSFCLNFLISTMDLIIGPTAYSYQRN